MNQQQRAFEAVECLRAGAGFREVYGLVKDLPGITWHYWDDGAECLLLRHPTIGRHWRAFVPAGGGSTDDEAEVAEKLRETLEAWLRAWDREPAGDNTTQHDTKDDTPKIPEKNNRKPRRMTVHAVDCARLYLEDNGEIPMKIIIDDYIERTGIKKPTAKTLMRTLNDNPEQWKVTRQQDDI